MLKLDPTSLFFSQNEGRNVKQFIFYYEKNNASTLFDYLVSLSDKLFSLFPILTKKIGCHCNHCDGQNNSIDIATYFKSFNLELEKKNFNTFLMSPNVKSILRKCQGLDIGPINGHINQTMGIYIVEDSAGLASQLFFDFNHDKEYWFSLETMNHFSEMIKSTDITYLNHYFDIKKDANELFENIKYANPLQQEVLVNDFNFRWKGAVTALAKKIVWADDDSISISIKDKIGFIKEDHILDINPELEKTVIKNANKTLFTLLLAHNRSTHTNEGYLKNFPKPLLQSLCRPGGLFWKTNVMETYKTTELAAETNKPISPKEDDNFERNFYNYCTII